MKKKENKKKTLEDIIPKETLDYILKTYHKIRDLETSCLKENEILIKQLVKIDEALQKIVDRGWLSESFTGEIYRIIEDAAWYHNKKGLNMDMHLGAKRELETTITRYNIRTGQRTVSRKTKGQPKQYAKSYIIGVLAAEIRERTGKANYELLADVLKPYYEINSKRLAIETKRIRESFDILHIIDTVNIEFPNTSI